MLVMAAKKMGRPKGPERPVNIRVSLTHEEHRQFLQLAGDRGTDMTVLIRALVAEEAERRS
jgi:hypothetical protein